MKRTTKQQQTAGSAPVGRLARPRLARPRREIEVRFFEAGREIAVEEFLVRLAEASAPRWRLTEAGRKALGEAG